MTRYPTGFGVALLALVSLAALGVVACSDAVDDGNGDPWNMEEPEPPEPQISGPDEVSFGAVLWRESGEETFTISNQGEGRLKVYEIEVEAPLELVAPTIDDDASLFVGAGQSLDVTVAFDAEEPNDAEGVITVESDDPEQPQFVIQWSAAVVAPCVHFVPHDEFAFGMVPVGEIYAGTVRLSNCESEMAVEVHFDGFSGDDAFRIDADDAVTEGDSVILGADDSIEINVEFEPENETFYMAALAFSTDDPRLPSPTIELTGTGIPADDCPTPVITAGVDSADEVSTLEESSLNAAPLDTLSLDATASVDAGGEPVDQVSWVLVDQPEDSNTLLEADADQMHNELYLDLAGVYVIELDVPDGDGEQNCDPERLTIMALVGSDIHVQLVWDTPGDPHRHNDHGADLDLHFLHPQGQWNQAPWDCYWQNPEPIWNDSDDGGNPTLDIDATDGWGPENINLNDPDEEVACVVHFQVHLIVKD